MAYLDYEIRHNNPCGVYCSVHKYRTKIYMPLLGMNGSEFKAARNACLEIRLLYPELPEVPLAENPGLVFEQDFVRLEQWLVTAMEAWKAWCETLNAADKNNQNDREIASKTKGKPGRPKVSKEEAQKRRKIKAEWERCRDTIKGANKKKCFCNDYEDEDITVVYLNNAVLRWCRDNPK